MAGTEADLECVRVLIDLRLAGAKNGGIFSSLPFDLIIGGSVCARVGRARTAGAAKSGLLRYV